MIFKAMHETFIQLYHEDGNTVSLVSGKTVQQIPLLRETVGQTSQMSLSARIDPLGRICVERSQGEFNQLLKCLRDGTWYAQCDTNTGLPYYSSVTQIVDAFHYYGLEVPPFCTHCSAFVLSGRRMCLEHPKALNRTKSVFVCCGQSSDSRGCRLTPHKLTKDLTSITFSSGEPKTPTSAREDCWTVNPQEVCLARRVEPPQVFSNVVGAPVILKPNPDPILPSRPFGVGYRPRNADKTKTDDIISIPPPVVAEPKSIDIKEDATSPSENSPAKKKLNRVSRRKTKLCPALKAGQCIKTSSKCRFAHSLEELRGTDEFYKTQLCTFWNAGSCKAGAKCRHAHGQDDLRI